MIKIGEMQGYRRTKTAVLKVSWQEVCTQDAPTLIPHCLFIKVSFV